MSLLSYNTYELNVLLKNKFTKRWAIQYTIVTHIQTTESNIEHLKTEATTEL